MYHILCAAIASSLADISAVAAAAAVEETSTDAG